MNQTKSVYGSMAIFSVNNYLFICVCTIVNVFVVSLLARIVYNTHKHLILSINGGYSLIRKKIKKKKRKRNSLSKEKLKMKLMILFSNFFFHHPAFYDEKRIVFLIVIVGFTNQKKERKKTRRRIFKHNIRFDWNWRKKEIRNVIVIIVVIWFVMIEN